MGEPTGSDSTSQGPGQKRIRLAWIASLLWGVATLVLSLAVGDTVAHRLGMAAGGATLVLIAFGLRNEDRLAGFAAALFALLDMAGRLVSGQGGVMTPFVLFALVAPAALQLERIRPRPPSRSVLGAAGLVAVFLLAGVAVASYAWPAKPTGPYEKAMAEFLKQVSADAGLAKRFKEAGQGAEALGHRLTILGARRLSDEQLVVRAGLLAQLLSLADQHSCAEQLRRGGSIDGAMRLADEGTLQRWLDLQVAAMLAEHRGAPAAIQNPSEAEMEASMKATVAVLSPAEAARFSKIRENGGDAFRNVGDADACWFLRTLVESVARLDPSSQRILARALIAD